MAAAMLAAYSGMGEPAPIPHPDRDGPPPPEPQPAPTRPRKSDEQIKFEQDVFDAHTAKEAARKARRAERLLRAKANGGIG